MENSLKNSIQVSSANEKRLRLLDLFRGLTLISMICYHAAWDLVWIFGVDWPFYRSFGGYLWQQSICWSFILLSGFCLTLGSHPYRRGLLVFSCGALVSLVTILFMPENLVLFGILTFMGSAMLLGGPLLSLRELLGKLWFLFMAAFSFFIFMLFKPAASGQLLTGASLPEDLYANLFTAYLGFPPAGFYSTDYFGLIPWLFLFLTGLFLGLAAGERIRGILRADLCRPLQFLGRHSLLIYMLHQPVIYFGLSLFFQGR